ncbi:hypothetical protein PUN28_013862 [Cardiocondyla obscurior]|uniref:Uncharacterized protein n=1 Tax=Cardiocondyla obscurior TaxID=286306 RepID=A0AAW2F7Q2_9HYME
MVLVLLIPLIGFVAAGPFPNAFNDRLVSRVEKALSLSTESRLDALDNGPNEIREGTNEAPSTPRYGVVQLATFESETRENEAREKRATQGRKHKALFLDYPLVSRFLHYPRVPTYEIDYSDNNPELTIENRSSKGYQESDIYYIRLPPVPYMFVPGLGYVSQPPTYPGAATLKPQIPLGPQLVQLHHQLHVRPARPQQTVNPFIKLPIDFVSNGKPTSVYQWQKKPGKKPADSPITNLGSLSADFVNNGKPTSIYQWQANLKPVKRPDDALNSLDMGPYTFNGKLTSVYLLGSDDTTSARQPIRHSNYQN